MQLVKPSIEHVDVTSDPLKVIEAAGRTCYKSGDKITDDSAENFVKMLLDKGHHAMIEHGNFILSVSDCFYEQVVDTIEREFLHLTNDVSSGNGSLISGNPRVFRDFCLHPYVDQDLQRAIAYELAKKAPLLFEYMLHDHLDITDEYADGDVVLFENINSLSSTEKLAHQVASYRIICDRGVTHEIVRHRLFSYAQESTRYCNYRGGVTFVIPPWIVLLGNKTIEAEVSLVGNALFLTDKETDPGIEYGNISCKWLHAMQTCEIMYKQLLDSGWTPQQARSVLPNSLKTEIVVTGNLQEWMHFFKLRCSPKAHPQMQEVANMVLVDMKTRIPVIFDDMG